MAIHDEKFYSILRTCISEGVHATKKRYKFLKEKYSDSIFIPKHMDFPSVSMHKSDGIPFFSVRSNKTSYAKILKDALDERKVDSWILLEEYVESSEEILDYFKYDSNNRVESIPLVKMHIEYDLINFIDSLFHQLDNSPDLESDKKSELIEDYFRSYYLDFLEYNIIVPILVYHFDSDEIIIDENISIVKISRNIQLARNSLLPVNTFADDKIVSAATYAFLIKGSIRRVENKNKWNNREQILARVERSYGLIDKLFANLRLAIKKPVGYCQVLANPVNFKSKYYCEVEDVMLFGRNKIPHLYNEIIQYENKEILHDEVKLFSRLLKSSLNSKKVKFAMDKLLQSDLRNRPHDGILDVSAGLESLLSDSTDNLKFKVSLRSAAICKEISFQDYSAIDVRKCTSKFYDLRSSIVHGSSEAKVSAKMEFELASGKSIDVYLFGKDILLHAIVVFIMNPEWEDVKFIDDSLFK